MTKSIKKSIDQILNVKFLELSTKQQSQIKGGQDTIGIQDIVDG